MWSKVPLNDNDLHRYGINTFNDIPSIAWSIYLALAYGTATDFLIASTMCFYLAKGISGFARTDTMIKKIMLFLVGSGMLTSATSVTVLICFVAMPNNLVFVAVEFMLPKLYTNCFLTMLNSRHRIRDESKGVVQLNNEVELFADSDRPTFEIGHLQHSELGRGGADIKRTSHLVPE